MKMPSDKKTIILWAVPRSTSTAFFRAMMSRSHTRCLLEPYSRAYYFGAERVSSRYEMSPQQDNCTFLDIKTLCEQQSTISGEVTFIKDMAYYLADRLHTMKYLPDNCTHTFLIREPKQSIYSLYKMSLDDQVTGWDHFTPSEVGYRELYQLYELVRTQLGYEPIVIDADDLLKYPEQLLRQYCSEIGIGFQESMVNWRQAPNNLDLNAFADWMPWFKDVLMSTTFHRSPTAKTTDVTNNSHSQPMTSSYTNLPKYVQRAVEESTPIYKVLYDKRLRPNLQL